MKLLLDLIRAVSNRPAQLSTNEHMRQLLGRPEVAALPNCRVLEGE